MYSQNMNKEYETLTLDNKNIYIHTKAKKLRAVKKKRIGGIQELAIYSENRRSEEMLSQADGRIYSE